jgi:FeS assembly SUF system regulator
MIRITRQTDYGIVLLTYMASHPERLFTAADLAQDNRLPLPMVSKVLKILARAGLLISHRGVKGGYTLARGPEAITVEEAISALEGPIAITDCIEATPGECDHESVCPTRSNWQRINEAIRQALEGISMAEMTHRVPATPSLVSLGGGASRMSGARSS